MLAWKPPKLDYRILEASSGVMRLWLLGGAAVRSSALPKCLSGPIDTVICRDLGDRPTFLQSCLPVPMAAPRTC
jgi:hypothetical protein